MLKQIMTISTMVCLILCSCSSNQEKTLLKKASKVHLESASIESDLHEKLNTLIQKKNSINIQGRALSSKELEFVDQIEQLEMTYLKWKDRFQTSENQHDFQSQTQQASIPVASGVNAREVYATQVSLKENISKLKEDIESMYEKWMNEV